MRTLLMVVAFCATAAGQPSFDAASVKPSRAGDMNSTFNTRADNVEAKNVELWELLVSAFEIKEYQLVGPDWLKSERFDIVAKAPLGTGDDEKLMPLLKALLTDRFKLVTHTEKRDLPCYALVVAKGGLKIKDGEGAGSSMNSHSDGAGGQLTAKHADMESVADWLSQQVERPVLDMTGLKGFYDFTLKYSKESARGLTDTPEHPIVTLAIQEQLGLRLEKRTAPVTVVVIDRAERVPAEN